ncbi:carboxypeptidase-like protein [Neolewinella xylanilytica]|uniref:Carboxypeptidase-like protein n=1 Tax=Neolewinella xylanilytica TaxID=1514080 RepID=A0A2S6I9Q9_9BACT|nr:carboxypeptidase-like regulatory domain-containing protein [Neolewinella xylanilytica]PPK88233.1 carboxypeptidase-like protein [Neolewinella xylanilytica]
MFSIVRLFPLAILALLSAALPGQETLFGRVLDSLSREAVPFATVYFDGTTVGTTTADDGSYRLPLSAVTLPATVVVTHLNYRTASRTATSAGPTEDWLLTPAANEIAAVEVGDRNNRAKNVAEFRERFLGTEEWSRGARLQFTDRLRFDRHYETDTLRNADVLVKQYGLPDDLRNVAWAIDGKTLTFDRAVDLRASSTGTLEADVPMLGYRVRVNLEHFVVNYAAGSTYGLGTYYFEPYEGRQGKARPKHRRNRQRAFYASSQHFLRSLYANDLGANGFATYEMIDGKARPIDLLSYLEARSDGEMAFQGLENRQITILYFHDRKGLPLPPDRRKRAAYLTSVMVIGGPEATFRADGTLGNSPIGFGGAMGASEVSRMLPSNYSPADSD